MNKRGSGILIPIRSLPSRYGIGDMGPWAYRFVDFLHQARQGYWQILPLNFPNYGSGYSPYSCISAYGGNPLLISPELLVQDGILAEGDISRGISPEGENIDYSRVATAKEDMLRKAWERYRGEAYLHNHFHKFCEENHHWLDDFCLFLALKDKFGGRVWREWPPELRDRDEEAIRGMRDTLREEIDGGKFFQYLFFSQWQSLKKYANERGVDVIGDIPIYVNYDSVEVWKNPEIFKLDGEKRPLFLSGVPPDYFSSTGQLWGDPVYRWDVLKEARYSWWISRIRHNFSLFNLVRIDHFRGFVAYWEVPAGEETAVNGQWIECPVDDFLGTILEYFPKLPVIAEDLGTITPEVREVIQRYQLPGMRVLLFAFGHDLPENPYAPHNHIRNCVVLTGTHDTNTVRGWFEKESSEADRKRLCDYVGKELSYESVPGEFIRLAMGSVADTVIIPIQDLLGLGEEARLNKPATTEGNWQWRLTPDQLSPALAEYLKGITEIYGRAWDSG